MERIRGETVPIQWHLASGFPKHDHSAQSIRSERDIDASGLVLQEWVEDHSGSRIEVIVRWLRRRASEL